MAKLRPAGKGKTKTKSAKSAIPCVIVLIAGFTLVFLLFYLVLKSSV